MTLQSQINQILLYFIKICYNNILANFNEIYYNTVKYYYTNKIIIIVLFYYYTDFYELLTWHHAYFSKDAILRYFHIFHFSLFLLFFSHTKRESVNG